MAHCSDAPAAEGMGLACSEGELLAAPPRAGCGECISARTPGEFPSPVEDLWIGGLRALGKSAEGASPWDRSATQGYGREPQFSPLVGGDGWWDD